MGYSLYTQIKNQPDLKSTIHSLLYDWNTAKYIELTLVLFLMGVNWLVEAVKWRYLLQSTEKFSIITALQSVLTGVAVSVVTPNRIGEYMGRILYLKNVHKLQGITVTIIGSFAQFIVTGFLGLVGLLYYLSQVAHTTWLYVLLALSIILCVSLTYLYFHLDLLLKITNRISFLKKVSVYIQVVKRFNQSQLLKILLYSICRYSVYTIQFVLLLKIFLVNIPMLPMILTIWVIFWAMAIVPTITLAELGIRGKTAVYFLSAFSTNDFGIISSSLMLWLINLIIPALAGCLFVFRMRLFDDE